MEPPQRNAKVLDVVARALIVASALLSAGLTLWLTAPHGAGVDSDSAQYLSAAESLTRGDGWIGVDGNPYTLWPPLFPSLLALLARLGIPPEHSVRWLHAACSSIVILGAALIVRRVTAAPIAAAACALALAVSPALFANVAMTWSEPVFLALVVAAMLAWFGYRQQPSRTRFVALCALSAAALLQRYLGIALVACLAFEMSIDSASDFKQRLRRVAVYVAASIAPIALWFARNALVTGGLDGKRGPAVGKIGHDLARAGEILSSWLSGYFAPPLRTLLVLIAAGLFIAAFVAADRQARAPARCVVVYLVAVIALRQAIEFDELDERLLAPVLPFASIALAIGAVALVRRTPYSIPALGVIGVWFALWAFGSIHELEQRATTWRADGIGLYETPRWQASPTVQWLREHRGADRWLTNDPFAFFCTLNARATPLPVRPQGFTKLHERLPREARDFRVAWFTLNERAVLPSASLDAHFDVECLQTFEDGEIYALRRK